MTFPAFYGNRLKARLSRLDKTRQLAFGAACCERLIPNYISFQQDSGYGDVTPVRQALDLVWAFLGGKACSADQIEQATIACESAAPRCEEFSSLFVASAEDACLAVWNLLDFLHKGDLDRIVHVATYATDSVDLYVQEIENLAPNDPNLEDMILNHRLMQREFEQQEIDLAAVERAKQVDAEFLHEMRSLWKNEGRGNLG